MRGSDFIAPDESYIIFDSKPEDSFGDSNLYISFRQDDGAWGEGINMGDTVNTEAEDGGPNITPDGKFLFFNRMLRSEHDEADRHSDLFWIDAGFIEALPPQPD